MKATMFTLFISLFPLYSFCQKIETLPEYTFYSYNKELAGEDSIVYRYPDKEAEFPGGIIALQKYISQNIVYPEGNRDVDLIGRIFVSFIVNTKGVISNVKLVRGKDKQMDDMALDLFDNMPKWIPAQMKGDIVRSYVLLPITICLF